MDRFLDCLDDSVGCPYTLDGWSLWTDRAAANADFYYRGLWALGLPDVPGLPAKTFQAADRWEIGGRACRREDLTSNLNLTV